MPRARTDAGHDPYPFGPFADLCDRLDRVFEDAFEGLIDGRRHAWRLSIDVIYEDNRYVMRADLPGIKPDEAKIEVADHPLAVSGEHGKRRGEEARPCSARAPLRLVLALDDTSARGDGR